MTKEEFFKFRLVEDEECTLCFRPDSIEHAFLDCTVTTTFYSKAISWFKLFHVSTSCLGSGFSADFTSGTRLKVLEMTWLEDTRRSWYQDGGNLEENYLRKNWFDLTFPHFLLWTDWVCASGLCNYFARDPLDFRFRLKEYGPRKRIQLHNARVIDIGAIESRSFDTFASFTHSLLWMERFSERKVSTIHANFPSV